MRAEIEGHPQSDSVRHLVLCSLERNAVSAHGIKGGAFNTHPIEHSSTILWVGPRANE